MGWNHHLDRVQKYTICTLGEKNSCKFQLRFAQKNNEKWPKTKIPAKFMVARTCIPWHVEEHGPDNAAGYSSSNCWNRHQTKFFKRFLFLFVPSSNTIQAIQRRRFPWKPHLSTGRFFTHQKFIQFPQHFLDTSSAWPEGWNGPRTLAPAGGAVTMLRWKVLGMRVVVGRYESL